jgi:hypothetical protein
MGLTVVGSACVPAWSMVTSGAAGAAGLIGTATVAHQAEALPVQFMATLVPVVCLVLAPAMQLKLLPLV